MRLNRETYIGPGILEIKTKWKFGWMVEFIETDARLAGAVAHTERHS